MIVKPRIRGFICTTAHPQGCAASVHEQIDYVQSQPKLDKPLKNVMVLGCSGGFGLASRINAAFSGGAATLGVSFEREASGNRTATAGFYNNIAFDEAARAAGLTAQTIDGDAYSDEIKAQVIATLKEHMGPLDLLVYSLASPVRAHPRTGELHRSAIKPVGDEVHIKSLNVDKGEVMMVDLEPATEEEIANTVAVMGGEDWQFWIDILREADLLAPGFRTVAYTYIGSELTWPIYWEATLGAAKLDLDRAAGEITQSLAEIPGGAGQANVVTLKAVVTQASSAIPVVPLYVSLLFKVMKDAGSHEEIIEHIYRLFASQLSHPETMNLDEAGRIRVDDWELADGIQDEVKRRWPLVTTENLDELGDLGGYKADFLKIFGFGFAGVDYDAEVDPTLGR